MKTLKPRISPPAVGPTIPRRRRLSWAGSSLLALLAATALLYTWDLKSSGYSDYYATAAKSMASSWTAFVFGAFDPNATITLDKLSGFLIPQALSIRIFGFTPWAIELPQVIEGLVTVAATYFIVSRWIGRIGGLLGATVMAFTPLLVSVFSHPMEDSMLTMFTTLSVAAWQRNIETNRTRYLLLAGALVGLGFQAKMMQAWLVLPAMVGVFLIMSPGTLVAKAKKLAWAGLVTVGVSLSWMSAIGTLPAGARPFIDGTTNNNIFAMVFGYNGTNHFLRGSFPGALSADPSPTFFGTGPQLTPLLKVVGHTPLKLLFPEYASQIGWLYPLAAAGLVLGLLELRTKAGPVAKDRGLRAGVLLSGASLLTSTLVLGLIILPHPAYLASMALPLAALAAIGAVLLWRLANVATSRWRYALTITVAVQTVWSAQLLTNFPKFASWLIGPILVAGLAACLVLFGIAHGGNSAPIRKWIIFPGVVALVTALLAPSVWSVSTINPKYGGSADDAYAGPRLRSEFIRPLAKPPQYGSGLDSNRITTYTATVEDKIYDYALRRGASYKYALATDTWRSAAPMIMDNARAVLPIGGYSSRVASPSLRAITTLIDHHELPFVLLTGDQSKNSRNTPSIARLHEWVQTNCSLVPSINYSLAKAASLSDSLYDCRKTPGH